MDTTRHRLAYRGTLALTLFLFPLLLPSIGRAATGPLANGGRGVGNVTSSTASDSWTFTANAGDSIFVRVGSTNFTPHIQLFNGGNVLIAETNSNNSLLRDGFVVAQATNSGTYTILVKAALANQSGGYAVYLAQAPEAFTVPPGDEGGPIANGGFNTGTITLGDLDMWSFQANAGDSLMLRVGSTNFTPWIRLYGPKGGLVGESTSANSLFRDGFLVLQATNAGTYTVVVSAALLDQFGGYSLSLAQAPGNFVVSPGDEGGALTNGTLNVGTITPGDLDMWSFQANAGDSLMLRVGSTNFTPWIRLYGPNGGLVGESTSANSLFRDGFLVLQATNAGTYTVVVSAALLDQFGGYSLSFAQAPGNYVVSPGDEGGALTNGTLNVGTITLGDLDLWNFTAIAGQGIMLRVGSTNFTPWIRLYGPKGELVGESTSENSLFRDGFLNLQATNAGAYTVVVSAALIDQAGGYSLSLVLAPSPIVVSAGQPGGALVNGVTNTGILNLGQLIVWSFMGTVGDSNVFRAFTTNFTPWIRLYGPTGALVGETNTLNSLIRQEELNYVVTDNGLYTVVLSAALIDQAGGFSFKQSRVPPDLIVPTNQAIDELTSLNVSISAQDPDDPLKPLVFNLLSAPATMRLTISSATNATLSWATTEADGPSTNVITATVTDTVNGKAYVRTNSFTVVVNEINTPPQLTVPANQTIDELTTLNVSASAPDSDIPTNTLTFSLVSPPSGMTIDPNTGAISWTPTEAQGPSTNIVQVVVTDSNPWAVNAQHMSVSNSFTVIVREVNTAPVLQPIPNQSLHYGVLLTLQAMASDADIPTNTLTFSFDKAPANMTINATTGLISWTPAQTQLGTNQVMVRVTDNGVPSLSATQSFQVVVAGSASSLAIQRLTSGLMELSVTGDTNSSYELQLSTDLQHWDDLTQLHLTTLPLLFTDPASASDKSRFYRLKLLTP